MRPRPALPVKLFSGVLYRELDACGKGLRMMEEAFGPVDWKSDPFPFEGTDYYAGEMGGPLIRIFVSFSRLIAPDSLVSVKHTTNQIEESLAVGGKRRVNLDPGYLDYDKVVLASAKYNGDKVYLGDGIWADLTLRYREGGFFPYPWSFPDFKSGRYEGVFLEIRRRYKQQMREGRQATPRVENGRGSLGAASEWMASRSSVMANPRPSWDDYFLEIANIVASRATCDRGRSGCVIVRDKRILVTGYVGSPPGLPHCDDVGHQLKKMIHEDGSVTQHCMRTIHAEQNAICQAARMGVSIEGATLYCRMTPCRVCAMLIISCGIRRVVCERRYHAGEESENLFKEAGIELVYKFHEIQAYEHQSG